jgi:type IV pilus assembly protein PilO
VAQNAILTRYPRLTKVGVGVLLTVLLGVAYFVLFYDEISEAIARQAREEQTYRSDLAQVKQAEFAYHKDLAELTERQQRQRDLNKILPETTEYPAFLSALQGVANISGVALQAWTPQEEVLQKFFARVPMHLSLQGKFHQVAKFFYGVGQLDRIINIENISLNQPKTQNDEVILKVDCLATAFHTLPAPKAAVAVPAEGAK